MDESHGSATVNLIKVRRVHLDSWLTCYPKFLTEDTLALILKLHASFFSQRAKKGLRAT